MSDPFKGRAAAPPTPMRVLHRFERTGGSWAEIRERQVTQWRAIEFLVYVDGGLLETQLFHGGREVEYPAALTDRIRQFLDDGWQRVPLEPVKH